MLLILPEGDGNRFVFSDGRSVWGGPATREHLEQLGYEKMARARAQARAASVSPVTIRPEPPLTADDLRHNSEWP